MIKNNSTQKNAVKQRSYPKKYFFDGFLNFWVFQVIYLIYTKNLLDLKMKKCYIKNT